MVITYKTGNLLDASERIIVQGCNAQGVMGKGLAKQIKQTMPEVFATYRRAYEGRTDKTRGLTMGSIVWAKAGDPERLDQGHLVANAITQDDYRRDPSEPAIHADYGAIAVVLEELDNLAQTSQNPNFCHRSTFAQTGCPLADITHIAFPLIGAGLAGGSWTRIAAIIEAGARHFTPVVYLMDGRIPTT